MGGRVIISMVQHIKVEKSIPILDGVDVSVEKRKFTAKGKYGTITRDFSHIPCELYIKDGSIHYRMWKVDTYGDACTNTVMSSCLNVMKGVKYCFEYKMRLVYNHFPINFNVVNGGKACEIRNFMGQKRTRCIKALGDTVISTSKTTQGEIIFTGPDVDHVSGTCALIDKSCTVRKKDIRKFLDGVYVSEKGFVEEVA